MTLRNRSWMSQAKKIVLEVPSLPRRRDADSAEVAAILSSEVVRVRVLERARSPENDRLKKQET